MDFNSKKKLETLWDYWTLQSWVLNCSFDKCFNRMSVCGSASFCRRAQGQDERKFKGARDATTNGQHLRSSTMVRNVSISQFKYVQLCRYASCGRWSYPFLKWTHHDSIYFPLLHQGDHACLLSCCNCQLRSSHCYALVQRTFPSGAFCCTSFTSFPLNCSAENASRPSPASLHKTITLLCHSQAVPPCLAQPHSMAASLGVRMNCAHLMADPSTVATSMNTSSRKNHEELIRIAYKHVDLSVHDFKINDHADWSKVGIAGFIAAKAKSATCTSGKRRQSR